MEERKTIGSGTYWENIVGYSRALRIGNIVEVAGTTSMAKNEVIGKGDAYHQTKFILDKIDKTLTKLGCSMKDVVRTRMYVTNIEDWEAIGKAHGEVFRDIKPVATMVEVSRLIKDELLVEIEVSAIIHSA
ncbi:MAG: RidA family protein [Aureispira sp.]|nr:RidA family protein [Aureispira sp.]